MPATMRNSGALVISLDLELHWGVRDRRRLDRAERMRLLSARAAALEIVELFDEFSVHATWATVGFLFARTRDELECYSPARKPRYGDPALDPYQEQVGSDESVDPFHFAPSLIDAIAVRPGQEIASHSFSHYYSCEPGQGPTEFEADMNSAIAIANGCGYRMRSYVFPRNQVNPEYLALLRRAGVTSYRGTQAAAVNAPGSFRMQQRPHRRLLRLFDNYLDLYGPQTVPMPSGATPRCVSASRYLRPFSAALGVLEDRRFRRIADAMELAAKRGEIFHLWWHPEDFARNRDRNLQFLRRVLGAYSRCRKQFGMRSLSMGEVAELMDVDTAGDTRVAQQAIGR